MVVVAVVVAVGVVVAVAVVVAVGVVVVVAVVVGVAVAVVVAVGVTTLEYAMPRDYSSFIASKTKKIHPTGFEPKRLNSRLFPWQADIVRWACRLGRASLFEDCGLGKAIQSLAWADAIIREGHGKTVLILCPLAVAQQTKSEAEKFSIETDCRVVREQSQVRSGINITNYDRLDKFDTSAFDAVVMDESSLLKGKGMAKTKKKILAAFGNCRFRLACTATPAPNDLTELAGHSEFMGLMREQEMLSMFFVHDSGHTQDWRLKGHGAKAFWRWVSSWAVSISKPSDLGDFSDDGYILPPLNIDEIVIEDSDDAKPAGFLFNKGSLSATGVHSEKRSTAERRAEAVAEKVNASDATTTPWLVWCFAPTEKVLLSDWRYVPIDSLVPGQKVMCMRKDGGKIKLSETVVKRVLRRTAPLAELRFGDGAIIGTADHKVWRRSRSPSELSGWAPANESIGCRIPSLYPPPECVNEREWKRGWLAGVAFGDGCFWTLKKSHYAHADAYLRRSLMERRDCEYRRFRLAANDVEMIDTFCAFSNEFGYEVRRGTHDTKGFSGTVRRMQAAWLTSDWSCRQFESWLRKDGGVDYHCGFLAGTFDAEGSVASDRGHVTISQDSEANPINHARIKRALDLLGFDYTDRKYEFGIHASDRNRWRFFALCRPTLKRKTDQLFGLSLERSSDTLDSVVDLGVSGPVVTLSTEAGNYFIGGHLVKNCDTDYEADALAAVVKDAVEVRGSDSIDAKEEKLVGFTTGKIRRMVSKPSLAGWGVNWQHCWNESFIGLSYSFEMMYQAIRRCLRFGQTHPVNVYIYSTETEYAINAAVWGKQKMHEAMKSEMAGLVREFQQENIYGITERKKREYQTTEMEVPAWL